MKLTKNLRHLDIPTLIMVSVLSLFGVLMIGSANQWTYDPSSPSLDPLMLRQLIGFGIGLVLIGLIMLLPYSFIRYASIPAYLMSVVLLVLVLRYGVGANEGDMIRRWLPVLGFEFQPSEYTKIALAMMLAFLFYQFREHTNHILVLLLILVTALVPLYLVYREPDLSTSIVIFSLIIVAFYSGKVSWWYILLGVLAFAAFSYLLYRDAISESPRFLSPYQLERITAWLHPEDYALTSAYQSMQSRSAIASGGLLGKGLFQNSGLVPIATTDFIFGIIGEELGLVGASAVMLIYFMLSFRLIFMGAKAKDVFGQVMCVSIGAMFGVQALINMGVCTAVLPNTGLPLPFISYGLSSLTANMAGVGLVLRINAERGE